MQQANVAAGTHSGLQSASCHVDGTSTVRRPVAGKANCVQAVSRAEGSSTGSVLGVGGSTAAKREQSTATKW